MESERQLDKGVSGHKWFRIIFNIIQLTAALVPSMFTPLEAPDSERNSKISTILLIFNCVFLVKFLADIGLHFMKGNKESNTVEPLMSKKSARSFRSDKTAIEVNKPSKFFIKTKRGLFETVVLSMFFLGIALKAIGKNQEKRTGTWNAATWGRGLEKTVALRILSLFDLTRIITRSDNIKVVVNSLMGSLPSILKLTVVEVLLFFMLGVINVNFFKGKFHSCDSSNAVLPTDFEIITQQDCVDYGGDWVNPPLNFDHIGNSLVLIFQMVTTEGKKFFLNFSTTNMF